MAASTPSVHANTQLLVDLYFSDGNSHRCLPPCHFLSKHLAPGSRTRVRAHKSQLRPFTFFYHFFSRLIVHWQTCERCHRASLQLNAGLLCRRDTWHPNVQRAEFLCCRTELCNCMKTRDKMKSTHVLCSQRISVGTCWGLLFYFLCSHKSRREVPIYLFQALSRWGQICAGIAAMIDLPDSRLCGGTYLFFR